MKIILAKFKFGSLVMIRQFAKFSFSPKSCQTVYGTTTYSNSSVTAVTVITMLHIKATLYILVYI